MIRFPDIADHTAACRHFTLNRQSLNREFQTDEQSAQNQRVLPPADQEATKPITRIRFPVKTRAQSVPNNPPADEANLDAVAPFGLDGPVSGRMGDQAGDGWRIEKIETSKMAYQ